MICSKCGNQIPDGKKFCIKCGAPLSEETEFLGRSTCSECGAVLDDNAVYCEVCGHRVADDSVNVQEAQPFSEPPVRPEPHPEPYEHYEPEEKRVDKVLIILLISLFVVVLASAGIIWYVYNNNKSNRLEVEDLKMETKGEKSKKNKEEDFDEDFEYSTEEAIESEDGYLFPSDRRLITEEDLEGKYEDTVALMLNEIYARHGMIFSSEPYKSYFEGKTWYTPNPDYSEDMLSTTEIANIQFINEYAEDAGWTFEGKF